jgi:hypothetical protein
VADLPALRTDELRRALVAAGEVPCGFAADAAGTGTTLLTARPGSLLDRGSALLAGAHGVRAARSSRGPSRACVGTSTPRSTCGTPGASAGQPRQLWCTVTDAADVVVATVRVHDRVTGAGSVLLDDGTERA